MYSRHLTTLSDISGGILLNLLAILEKTLDFALSIASAIMLSHFDTKKNHISARLKSSNVAPVANILSLTRISGAMNGIVPLLMFPVLVWNKVFVWMSLEWLLPKFVSLQMTGSLLQEIASLSVSLSS